MIDYIAMMQEATDDFVLRQKYHGSRNDGFLTDAPKPIQFSEDDYIRVRYDAKAMRWIPSQPSRIKYQTARQLIKQIRKKYAEKWGV